MTGWMTFAAGWMGALMLVLCWRIWRGPTTPDRVVALDAVNTMVVATMLLLSARMKEPVFADVAIVYALLSYVGTLFIARTLERKGERQ